jgi:hypothetical protein
MSYNYYKPWSDWWEGFGLFLQFLLGAAIMLGGVIGVLWFIAFAVLSLLGR